MRARSDGLEATTIYDLAAAVWDSLSPSNDEVMPEFDVATAAGHSYSPDAWADYADRFNALYDLGGGVRALFVQPAKGEYEPIPPLGHNLPAVVLLPNGLAAGLDIESVQYLNRAAAGLWDDTVDRLKEVLPRAWYAVHNIWLAICPSVDEQWPHPLAPLIKDFLRPPRPVAANPRQRTGEDRIIPSKLAQIAPADHRAGEMFSVAAHATTPKPREQLVMPGFGYDRPVCPALPLALYDLGAGPATSPGQGAPIALRMFVESVLAVNQADRGIGPVALDVALRDFLTWLYPGRRKPRPGEYWPRLMAAVEALDSRDARIPIIDPETGRGQLRRLVSVGAIPRGPDALDDAVRIVVDLPMGWENGPQVSNRLRHWGVRSAAAYRLLLNLAYRWWEPGKTHYPVGRGQRRHWLRVDDPKRYEPLGDDELVAMAFPTSTRVQKRNVLAEARATLAKLAAAGELRIVEDRRILPPTSRAAQDD